MKLNKVNIALILLYIGILVLIGYSSPKEINWTRTYSGEHTLPFGCKIVYQRLGDIFGRGIEKSAIPLYNMDELDAATNLVYVTSSFNPDKNDVERLLAEVDNGANAFIAAENISKQLADSLKIDLSFSVDYFGMSGVDSSKYFSAVYANSPVVYRLQQHGILHYIAADSQLLSRPGAYTPLCTAMGDKTIMARLTYGKGRIFIQSFPLAFTNYNILDKPNDAFVARALSMLPVQHTIWDEYYKPLRNEKAGTPLRFILSSPPLKWAYYISIAFLLLYVLFSLKRVQRIIPIILPHVNQSLEFTRTVGSLYFNAARDHRDIALKKMVYFLERIRLHYNMSTPYNDDTFQQKLAAKSGVPIEVIADIFAQYNYINKSGEANADQLKELTKAIENFYSSANITFK